MDPLINDHAGWSIHAARECSVKMRLLGVPERFLGRVLAAFTDPHNNVGPGIMSTVFEML